MTTAERITQIETEIAQINTALSNILKAGQDYIITTGSGFGSSRRVTMADYDTLVKHRDHLQAQLDTLNDTRAVRVRAGW